MKIHVSPRTGNHGEIADSREFTYATSTEGIGDDRFQTLFPGPLSALCVQNQAHVVYHSQTGRLELSTAHAMTDEGRVCLLLVKQQSSGLAQLIVADPDSESTTASFGSLDLPFSETVDAYVILKDAWEEASLHQQERKRHQEAEDQYQDPSRREISLGSIIESVEQLRAKAQLNFAQLRDALLPIRLALRTITEEAPEHPLSPALEAMRATVDLENRFGTQERYASEKCHEVLEHILELLKGATPEASVHLSGADMARYERCASLTREFWGALQLTLFSIEALLHGSHSPAPSEDPVPEVFSAHICRYLQVAEGESLLLHIASVLGETELLQIDQPALATAIEPAIRGKLKTRGELATFQAGLRTLLSHASAGRRMIPGPIEAQIFTQGVLSPPARLWEAFSEQVAQTTRTAAAAASGAWRGLERSWSGEELRALYEQYAGRLIILSHQNSPGGWLLSLNSKEPAPFVEQKLRQLEALGEFSEPANYGYLVRIQPRLTRIGATEKFDLYQWLIDLERSCALLEGKQFSLGRQRIASPEHGTAANGSERDHARVGYRATSLEEVQGPHRYRIIRTNVAPRWPEKP